MLFSVTTQTFYDNDLYYPDLPDDVQLVTKAQHAVLYPMKNEGCIIFPDFTWSTPKPSKFHEWNGRDWIDSRTAEEVLEQETRSLPPLSAKDFRHMLDRAGLREQVESLIESIPDAVVKSALKTEYEYAQFFERTHPAVLYMIKMLNLTDERVNTEWKTPISLDHVLPGVE